MLGGIALDYALLARKPIGEPPAAHARRLTPVVTPLPAGGAALSVTGGW